MIVASVLSQVVLWLRTPDNWWGPTGVIARLAEHAEMSFAALTATLVLTLPLAVFLGHRRRFGVLAINVSNAGRAIPSFAILVVGTQLFGLRDVPVIGSWFVFAALIVLAAPSIVTNAWVGMAEVPDEVRDAARGMGLTEFQSLWRVELPLAWPLIMGGIRTAAILVVATATIAAQVGSGGLGRFIVEGFALGPDAYDEVFAGALLVAAFALVTEMLLAFLQRLTTPGALRRPAVLAAPSARNFLAGGMFDQPSSLPSKEGHHAP